MSLRSFLFHDDFNSPTNYPINNPISWIWMRKNIGLEINQGPCYVNVFMNLNLHKCNNCNTAELLSCEFGYHHRCQHL